jgi:hypothetical protein
MKYWVKRIILKSGELVTERELSPTENLFEGKPPVVGDTLKVRCRGRDFSTKVVWGNWPGRADKLPEDAVVPLRVEEI